MAYSNGQEIGRPAKRPWAAKSHIGVVIGGERKSVEIRHVSRETLNLPRGNSPEGWLIRRPERHALRKARMRLRKLRGWR